VLLEYPCKYFRAAFAAWNRHIPCTPPPGGVDEEQRKIPLIGVRYGTALKIGRATICHKSLPLPVIVPPTRQSIKQRCFQQILLFDIVFAWIEDIRQPARKQQDSQ
jgi:hypothetical protein